jgi:tetratricopeptide (TPR) repeat protein
VVLVHYLLRLLVPSPGAFSPYHDDFPVSAGLLDPPWTLAAVIAIAGMAAAGVALRRRFAALSFGILWFLGGHLLESTHLNLFLYFEHRNYLPSLGLFFALSWILIDYCRRSAQWRWWAAAAAAYAMLTVGVTIQNSLLWGNRLSQAQEAVRTHPRSVWAREDLGSQYLAAGSPVDALALFREMERDFPGHALPRLRQMAIAGCVLNTAMTAEWWRQTIEAARQATAGGSEVLAELDRVIWVLGEAECSGVDTGQLLDWVEALAGNGAFDRQRGGLLELAASLSLYRNEWQRALVNLTQAARASPTANRQMQLIELLVAMGDVEQAESALTRLDDSLQRRPLQRLAYAGRIEELRRQLGDAGGSSR